VRLLIVDDDAGLRALLRTTFEGFDVLVDEAESAGQAAERMKPYRVPVRVWQTDSSRQPRCSRSRSIASKPSSP